MIAADAFEGTTGMTGNLPRLKLCLFSLKIVLHQIATSGDTQIIYKLPLLRGIRYFYLRPKFFRLIDGSFPVDKWELQNISLRVKVLPIE